MSEKEIAKNLLEDKVCENCTRRQDEESCMIWWGSAFGWQWCKKKGTCEQWIDNDDPYYVKDVWIC